MDRNLPGNHRFWLNEDSSCNSDGKMHIFVKLTDSCMKTIETYLKMNKKTHINQKPIIKFNPNGGEISIPTTNNERKSYSFNISPEDKTPEVFQCIKQINRDQLESCALIEQRLNIHGQDDSYSMTRIKVFENQKNDEYKQTKEIGESSKTILQMKTNKSSNPRSSTTATLNSSKQTRTNINAEQHSSPTNNQLLSSERPLRERLVHLLASRPYKKPELLLRLRHDGGIRDDERDQLDSILSSISTQSKTGEFNILKAILINEVNPDWPYYPKGLASSVRKKIRDLQPNIARPNPEKTQNDTQQSSTNRLSSTSSNVNVNSSLNLNSNAKISSTQSTSGTKTKQNSSKHRLTTTTDKNSLHGNDDLLSTADNTLTDERIQQLSDMLEKISSALSISEKSNDQLFDENDSNDEYDIEQAEKEYNRLVPEYNSLIDYLQTISDKFSVLEQQFNEEKTNEKASKIVEEFLKYERNDGFINKRQRLIELHVKLNNLKKFFEKNSPSIHFSISDDENNQD